MSTTTRKSDTHEEWYAHFKIDDHEFVTHVTVFARRPKAGGEWRASLALCVPGDQFSRRVGRQVARRRFFQGEYPHAVFPDVPARELYQLVEDHLHYALTGV